MNDDLGQKSLPLSLTRVLEVMENGAFSEEVGIMRWSSNYAFLVSLSLDDLQLNAVYKPQRGERPLWDFPDGTLCYRERASYLTSQALGWQIVPPTGLREGPRGLGSVQFFIEHDPDINYFTFDESFAPQLQRFAAFDVLVNNADRKGGHCLLDSQGHVWGIDHGITFNATHKLRTVIWDFAGQPIPDPLLEDVARLYATFEDASSPYRCALDDLLSAQEVTAFERRIKRILKSRIYPTPGPGPNYPWPPV